MGTGGMEVYSLSPFFNSLVLKEPTLHRAGRCLKFFKGGCFVKVGFCNILKVGFLSRWVFATF